MTADPTEPGPLAGLVAAMPGPAVVHSLDGERLAANSEGLAVASRLRIGASETTPWEHACECGAASGELAVDGPDGVTWMLAQSRRVTVAGAEVVVTVFVDNTDRQQWARLLMGDFVERFRASWARSGLPVFLIGADGPERGRVTATNEAAASLLGLSPHAIEGTPIADLFVADDADAPLVQQLDSLLRGDIDSVSAAAAARPIADVATPPAQVTLGLTCAIAPEGRPLFVLGHALNLAPVRAAEAAALHASRRAELVQRHSSDVVAIVDASGAVEWICPSIIDKFGRTPHHLVGAPVLQLFEPEDHPLVNAALAAAHTEAALPAPAAARVLDANGHTRPVEVLATNLRDEPTVNGVMLTIRDRSSEARFQAADEDRERRYRQIVEVASDGIASIDSEMRVAFASQRLCEILGRPLDDLVGRSVWDLVADEQVPATVSMLADDPQRRYDRYPMTLQRGDGQQVRALVSAAPVGEGGLIAWVSDVSESERTKEELQWSEARLEALLGALPDLIFRLAADGTYLDYHSPDPSLLVVPPEQFLGKRIVDIFPDEVAPGVAALYERTISQAIANREVQALRYELGYSDGAHQFEARVTPLGANEVLTVIRDVSDLHRSESRRMEHERALVESRLTAERAELERELERASRAEAMGHLAATMAHDVNNLLGVIANYAASVQLRSTDPDIDEDAEGIHAAVERGAELTKRLLRIGRTQDADDLHSESVRDVLRDLAPSLERLFAGDTAPTLTVDLGDEQCIARCSRSRIEQAVMNLVINARDASIDAASGGEVSLSLRRATDTDACPQHWLVISVEDHAGGIPNHIVDHIFEPFFTTKGDAGSGLGLPIVHGVAQFHRGRVEIHPVAGGTRVELWLPATPARDTSDDASNGQGPSVLLVDDDVDVLCSTARLLTGCGCRVLTCGGAVEALEVLRSDAVIDVVVTDVRMPHTTGPELALAARAIRSDLPVVLVTGYPQDVPDDPRLADVPVLSKPFTMTDLMHGLGAGVG